MEVSGGRLDDTVVAAGVAGAEGLAMRWFACAPGRGGGTGEARTTEDPYRDRRLAMVAEQIEARGITDARVLEALRRVPRHLYVPVHLQPDAYRDGPLSIGHRQTISQPYIVALMTELIEPAPGKRVLEIGTGSGYQAAALAEIVDEVFTIEIVSALGEEAARRLGEHGYTNVHARIGDGFDGWPEQAPFDGIVVTAAPERVPRPLLDQLATGGRLVIPVGRHSQELVVVARSASGLDQQAVTPVRFVPMTGKAERP
jgi:protein-L-isoaspartate(D-aspartate) O-methyltransferase